QKELKVLKGHDQSVTAVTFANDADTIVTASMDRTIRVWSVKAVKEMKEIKKEEKPKDKTEAKKKDAKDKKDVKKDKKDDKKDQKEPEPKVEINPKDLGEIKRLGPTTDDPYAVAWSPKTKKLGVLWYSGQIQRETPDD